jgi:c-di-GMP phosphodiesterase
MAIDTKQNHQLEDSIRKTRQFQHLLIKVGIVYAILSIGLYFLFSALMQNHAYKDMSKDEIHQISEMVFESMYTAMLAGQGVEGIESAAQRMRNTGPGMLITVVRGEIVAEKYGDNKIDQLRRINDLSIFQVFKTGKEDMIHKDKRVRFLYPAKFRQQCQECHENSKPGQVAAVVEIVYPIEDLKVSTDYVEKLMLSYFLFSFVVLIAFLSWRYKAE